MNVGVVGVESAITSSRVLQIGLLSVRMNQIRTIKIGDETNRFQSTILIFIILPSVLEVGGSKLLTFKNLLVKLSSRRPLLVFTAQKTNLVIAFRNLFHPLKQSLLLVCNREG